MTKVEFEDRVGCEVSEENYAAIEYIYTWHPSISNCNGKDEIALIYKIGGMRIINDMFFTAKKAESLDAEIRKHQTKIDHLTDLREKLERGDDVDVWEIGDSDDA